MASTGSPVGPFGFVGAGGYQTDASGLQLLGHRYYDSSTGRFLTRDTDKNGRNWYDYAKNNPCLWIDETGCDEKVLGIIRKAIANGELPPGTAGAYNNKSNGFAKRVDMSIGKRKLSGPGRHNPDVSEEDVIEAVKDHLPKNLIEDAKPPTVFLPPTKLPTGPVFGIWFLTPDQLWQITGQGGPIG
jgi:RHS repeat-associated protein